LKKKRRSSKGDNKISKRRQGDSSSSRPAPERDDNAEKGSGDEYDSGDDVKRTVADDQFIDEDDDMADLAGEYNAEEQVFDDERPDDYAKNKAKAGRSSSSSSGGGGGGSRNAGDPFSQTLDYMKKPKEVLMSEAEKDKITEQLLHRMHDALVKDEALFRKGEPPVHKLQMLKTVQQVVSVKTLQHNLLEKDILGAFKDWIEPKRDTAKTLPSLSVRTAVYEMLAKLPCQTDHLKRTDGDKKPIGYTILALRKHKAETVENKRALKDLMEKWCRPVFRKSADARSTTRDATSTAELAALAKERHLALAAAAAAKEAAGKPVGAEGEEEVDPENEEVVKSRRFADTLAGNLSGGAKDIMLRAKTPYSSGFLFTVQPNSKIVERKPSNEKAFGQTRAELLKKMGGKTKAGGVGAGTKLNPRAMDMVLSGRNKA
jgi:hypothetical protein